MASITVNSGSLNLSGTGVIAAINTAPPPAPFSGAQRIVLVTGTGKRFVAEFTGFAPAEIADFAVNDAVTVTNNGDGTTTISK